MFTASYLTAAGRCPRRPAAVPSGLWVWRLGGRSPDRTPSVPQAMKYLSYVLYPLCIGRRLLAAQHQIQEGEGTPLTAVGPAQLALGGVLAARCWPWRPSGPGGLGSAVGADSLLATQPVSREAGAPALSWPHPPA